MSERISQPRAPERGNETERAFQLFESLEASVTEAIESGNLDLLLKLRGALASILDTEPSPVPEPTYDDALDVPAPEPAEVFLPPEPKEAPVDPREAPIQPDRETTPLPILDEEETWPNHTIEIGGSTTRVERTEAERIFDKVEIHGDGKAGALTPELLEQAGLLPHHRLNAEGRTLWFSRGYDLGNGRVAVTGYVQDDDGSVVARSYYRSNSQGVWRYLPQYSVGEEGEVSWYSKGYGEESITLPARLQEGLTRSLEDDGGILALEKDVAQTAFTGTARTTGSEGTVYHRNIAAYPRRLADMPEKDSLGELPSPETLQPNPEQSPDFASRLASWRQDTTLYGRVHYDVYPSNDGKLKYTFCRDVKGRAWVSGIENNSPLDSTGLHEEWFSGGALTTPAYEYAGQAGSYGNLGDAKGSYVDMFQNYLSKVPVVQEYASREVRK